MEGSRALQLDISAKVHLQNLFPININVILLFKLLELCLIWFTRVLYMHFPYTEQINRTATQRDCFPRVKHLRANSDAPRCVIDERKRRETHPYPPISPF